MNSPGGVGTPLEAKRPHVNRLTAPFGNCGLPLGSGVRNRTLMADAPPNAPSARIEKALARIEAAATARAYTIERLTHRHAALREKIEDAVASLDALIAREKAEAD